MHRVHRKEMDGTAKNSPQPMREKPLGVAGPIGLPRTRPAQCRGDDQDIEIADMVGGDHERPGRGQSLGALDPQAEQPAHQNPVQRVESKPDRRQQRPGRGHPIFAVWRNSRGAAPGGVNLAFYREAQQIADCLNIPEIFIRQGDACAFVQRDRQLHPAERIQVQIEAENSIEVEALVRKALSENAPDRRGDWILE